MPTDVIRDYEIFERYVWGIIVVKIPQNGRQDLTNPLGKYFVVYKFFWSCLSRYENIAVDPGKGPQKFNTAPICFSAFKQTRVLEKPCILNLQ